jgi:tetratricopeptide (TPR) repeat protein
MLDLRGREPEALGALASLYEKQGMWWDLAEVYERELSVAKNDDDRINILTRRARLYAEKIARTDMALGDWNLILEIDPSNLVALRSICTIHRREGDAKKLITGLHGIVERASHILDPEELKDIFRELAQIYFDLEAPHNAAHALKRLLELGPDAEAMDSLERFYRSEGQWNDVVELKMMRADAITDLIAKVEEYKNVASICNDTMHEPDAATVVYQRILDLKPSSDEAFLELEKRHAAAGRWTQLIELYLARFDSRKDVHERTELLRRIARVCEEELEDDAEAFVALLTALEEDVDDRETVARIEAMARKLKRFPELIEAATQWLHQSTDSKTKIRLCMHLAKWYGDDLGQPEYAQPYYAQILKLDPNSVGSLEVYREVLAVDPENLQALRGLGQAYESMGQWPDLLRVLERELQLVNTQRERMVVLMRLAQLQEQHFLKPDLAAQKLEQVLEIDPTYEEALFDLERNYKRQRKWRELARTLERHALMTADPATKADLLIQMAELYVDELEDPKRAITCYRGVIEVDEANVEANSALAKLYEKQGDPRQSIRYQVRLAELTDDPRQRAEAFFRVGYVLQEKLADRISARARYEMAVKDDPGHVRALAALRQLAITDGDYDAAARYLDQESQHTDGPRQRARLLVELGNLHAAQRHDNTSAAAIFEAAHQADAENEEAAGPLLEGYWQQRAWDKLEPLLELVIRKSTKRPRPEQRALFNKLGKACLEQGKNDKAHKAYTSAYQLDISDQDAIRGVAEAAFRLRDWNQALTKFLRVVTSLTDENDRGGKIRAEVHYKLGSIKRELSQRKQAITHFEKSLDIDSRHRPSLEACAELYIELKDWPKVVTYKRRILEMVTTDEERFTLLEEISDVWRDCAAKPEKALEALEEARKYKPGCHALLFKMLELYQTTEDWTKMIETIKELASLDHDPGRRAKFLYAIGKLYRDKKGDVEHALALFNDALDLNPMFVECFERITSMLTEQCDWKGLERAFRKMLRRLVARREETAEPSMEMEYSLWHGLGLIYRDRLGDSTAAIEAFKMATRFRDDAATDRHILAELFEGDDRGEEAAAELARALERDPMREDAYRTLCRLYLKEHHYDRAWCACSVLAFLHKADENELRFFEDSRPRGMIPAKGRLDNEQWVKNLFHEEENLFIGKIFDMITPAAMVLKTKQLMATRQLPTLDRRFRQDPATSTVTFAKAFGWAAHVLGLPLPELYVRNDVAGALLAVPASPPASVAGQTVLSGFTPQELTFIVGKHLAYYRGEHYIKNLYPTVHELKVVLYAAIQAALKDFPAPEDVAAQSEPLALELLKYMQPVQRQALRFVVKRFIEEGAKIDLERWVQTVEITAVRTGLLLCADLDIAKKVILAEPHLAGELAPADKIKELLVFSVSEPYFALRRALGVAIEMG